MREDINILWLDDELNSYAHDERKEIVKDILEDKGYKAVFKECSTFEEADAELATVKRYDFFISDFNLEDEETGLTYLERIRERNGYKQFVILYSNNAYSTIKDEIVNVVKEKSIDIFSNFTFFLLVIRMKKIIFGKQLILSYVDGTSLMQFVVGLCLKMRSLSICFVKNCVII